MKLIVKLIATVLISSVSLGAVLAGETLDRVMGKKLLKVATDANYSPQSFLNKNNEMDGFDVNVAQEIGKRLGVKVEFVTPDWAILTSGKWNGRWDLSVGSMSPTKERRQVLDFPAIYYYTPASFAVHTLSKASKYEDLNGKKVGVTTASVYEQYMKKDLVHDVGGAPPISYVVTTDNLGSYQVSNVALDDLRLGDGVRLSAVLTGLPSINEAIKNNYPIRALGAPVYYEPLALATDKGDAQFHDKLKSIIDAMRQDGTLSKLSNKWYGVDYSTMKK